MKRWIHRYSPEVRSIRHHGELRAYLGALVDEDQVRVRTRRKMYMWECTCAYEYEHPLRQLQRNWKSYRKKQYKEE